TDGGRDVEAVEIDEQVDALADGQVLGFRLAPPALDVGGRLEAHVGEAGGDHVEHRIVRVLDLPAHLGAPPLAYHTLRPRLPAVVPPRSCATVARRREPARDTPRPRTRKPRRIGGSGDGPDLA